MKALKKKKKQIHEENAREIACLVKESVEKFIAEERKTQIIIPKPEKLYCMEFKFYETDEDYNTELNKRIYGVELRQKADYDTGKYDTARDILNALYNARPEDIKSKIVKLASEYQVILVRNYDNRISEGACCEHIASSNN